MRIVRLRDYQDILSGAALMLMGGGVAIYSLATLNIGPISQMGPGMFPAALGSILAFFGLLLVVRALFRPGPGLQIRTWTPLFVLAGVGAFALLIRPFGLIPAILGVTIISSFAELEVRPVSLALLCASLCLMAWLIFQVGLGLPTPMFRSPF